MNSVLITGASSGIGAETARVFSQNNYFVFLAGRNEQRLQQVKKTLQNSEKSKLLVGDITESQWALSITQTIEETQSQYPLSILINNAGVTFRQKFLETPDSIWEEQFQTNLLGPVRLTRQLIPLLLKAKNSSILNISSCLGMKPIAETSAYSAIKAAMNNWTKTLALELAPQKIRVNCIAPGLVRTPIHEFYGNETPELQEQLNGMQPIGRIGETSDIAQSIYFISSPLSSWTTGSEIVVDGGISL